MSTTEKEEELSKIQSLFFTLNNYKTVKYVPNTITDISGTILPLLYLIPCIVVVVILVYIKSTEQNVVKVEKQSPTFEWVVDFLKETNFIQEDELFKMSSHYAQVPHCECQQSLSLWTIMGDIDSYLQLPENCKQDNRCSSAYTFYWNSIKGSLWSHFGPTLISPASLQQYLSFSMTHFWSLKNMGNFICSLTTCDGVFLSEVNDFDYNLTRHGINSFATETVNVEGSKQFYQTYFTSCSPQKCVYQVIRSPTYTELLFYTVAMLGSMKAIHDVLSHLSISIVSSIGNLIPINKKE